MYILDLQGSIQLFSLQSAELCLKTRTNKNQNVSQQMLARPEFNFKRKKTSCNAIHQFKLNWPCKELHLKASKVADCSSKKIKIKKNLVSRKNMYDQRQCSNLCKWSINSGCNLSWTCPRCSARNGKKKQQKTLMWNKLEDKWGRVRGQRAEAAAERSGMSRNTSCKQSCRRTTDKERVANTRWLAVRSHCECFGGAQMTILYLHYCAIYPPQVVLWERHKRKSVFIDLAEAESWNSWQYRLWLWSYAQPKGDLTHKEP